MEESLFLLKTLFEEDSDFVLNNSQNGLNTDLDLENIFTIISKAENEINIKILKIKFNVFLLYFFLFISFQNM